MDYKACIRQLTADMRRALEKIERTPTEGLDHQWEPVMRQMEAAVKGLEEVVGIAK